MAKVRSVLIPATIEVAKAKRKCGRNKKHAILKGDKCLVLKDASTGYAKNYCEDCAMQIIEHGEEALASLKWEFDEPEGLRAVA